MTFLIACPLAAQDDVDADQDGSRSRIAAVVAVLDRYPDLGLGLADASLVVLAERHGATDILTLDERHFRALVCPRGSPSGSCRRTRSSDGSSEHGSSAG